MAKRYFDICVARPKFGGNENDIWWHKVGKGVENEKGQIALYFDSHPLNGKAMCFPQQESVRQEEYQGKGKPQQQQQGKGKGKPKGKPPLDDEIPF